MGGLGIPGRAEAARDSVQRAETVSTATTADVSHGKHDGSIYYVKPDVAAVCDATDDDARVHTYAFDSAAANAATASDGASTADDGTNGAIKSNDTASAIRRAAIGASHSIMLDSEWDHKWERTSDSQGRKHR